MTVRSAILDIKRSTVNLAKEVQDELSESGIFSRDSQYDPH